jgi:hypothetical protein
MVPLGPLIPSAVGMSDGSRKQASKPRPKAASKRKAAANGKRSSARRKPAASRNSSRNPWVPAGLESPPKPAASSKAAKPRRPAAPPRRRDGSLDINDATFEQLREVGLSIGQSARLIERRRLNGAFASFDEVAKLRGFSRRQVREFGAKLRIGSAR